MSEVIVRVIMKYRDWYWTARHCANY